MTIDNPTDRLPSVETDSGVPSFAHLNQEPKIDGPLRVGFYWVLACVVLVATINLSITLAGQKPNPFIALMAVGTPAGAVMIVSAIVVVLSNETGWRLRSRYLWFVGGAILAQTIMFANFKSTEGFAVSMMRATELAWIPFGAFTAALAIFWMWGTNITPPISEHRRSITVKHLFQITFAGALLCGLSRTGLNYRIGEVGIEEQFAILISLFATGFLYAIFAILLLYASLAGKWWLYFPVLLYLAALVAAPVVLGPITSPSINTDKTATLVAMALLLGCEIWFLVFLFYLEGLKLGKRHLFETAHEELN